MLFSLVLFALAFAFSASAHPHRSGRIMGGEPTTIETHPYQVSVELFDVHGCGGSIISAHYVITAGHCVDKPEFLKYQRVRAGTSKQSEGGSIHQIDKIYLHEKYGETKYFLLINDIAIIRVKEPFVFDETRQPIKLYGAGEEAQAGAMAVVAGWGETESGFLTQLRTVSVPIVSKKLCNEAYKHVEGLYGGQICAGYYGVGGKGICGGDSGSPLVINGRQAGIVSDTEGCALPDFPDIYTEIAAFRDWIDNIVKLD